MFYIQLIGLLAFCILVLSFYKKDIKVNLVYQITANFIYAVHYFLLGGLSGTFISLIGILRNILLIKVKNNKIIIPILCIPLYLLITILFYEKVYSIFPMVGNALYLYFLLKNNRKSLLIGSIINSIFWILYAIFISSYVTMITESIIIISNSIQLVKSIKKSN